jgi:hypothetical protein
MRHLLKLATISLRCIPAFFRSRSKQAIAPSARQCDGKGRAVAGEASGLHGADLIDLEDAVSRLSPGYAAQHEARDERGPTHRSPYSPTPLPSADRHFAPASSCPRRNNATSVPSREGEGGRHDPDGLATPWFRATSMWQGVARETGSGPGRGRVAPLECYLTEW